MVVILKLTAACQPGAYKIGWVIACFCLYAVLRICCPSAATYCTVPWCGKHCGRRRYLLMSLHACFLHTCPACSCSC